MTGTDAAFIVGVVCAAAALLLAFTTPLHAAAGLLGLIAAGCWILPRLPEITATLTAWLSPPRDGDP